MSYANVTTATRYYSRFWELFEYSLTGNAEYHQRDKYSLNFDESVSGSLIWYTFEFQYKGHKLHIVTSNGNDSNTKEFSISDINKYKMFDEFTQSYKPVIDHLFDCGLVFTEITSVTPAERWEMGKSEMYLEYNYHSRNFSKTSHNMTGSGMMSEQLDGSFNFWLGEGYPIGEWLEFVEPVIAKTEAKTGASEYAYAATPQDFDNELHIASEKEVIVKWTLLDHELLLYLSVGKREFYFEVRLDESPTVTCSVQLMEDKSAIDYRYDDEGRIEALIYRMSDQTEVYRYDSDKGFLTRKLTIPNDNSDTYVEDIFDTDKEYRKFEPTPQHNVARYIL